MPVASKISAQEVINPPRPVPPPPPPNSSLQIALTFYFANRETPVPRYYKCQNDKMKKVINHGYSIRRVAQMHEIAYSLLQRAIQAGGETKTRSQAHENDMVLTIAEEEALEEWCLHMHRWGYPTRLELLRSMACAIVEDRQRRNLECASDFFLRTLDPTTAVERRDRSGNLIGPNLELVGKTWYKRFLSRHPALSAMYSRSLDNSRALNNDPRIIREYFRILKEVIAEFKIKPENIYNMDEKGFLLGLIQRSVRVVVNSSDKTAFLRQPGQRETITVIETVGVFGQNVPPMIIMKGEKHLYGWYYGEMPDHWTTAISPNGWTDGYLALQWLERNFKPHTRPTGGEDEYRLLIFDGHESHLTYDFIEYAYAHRIKCLCLPAHSTHLLQPLDVVIFGRLAAEYSTVLDNASRRGITGVDKELFMQLFQEAHKEVFTNCLC